MSGVTGQREEGSNGGREGGMGHREIALCAPHDDEQPCGDPWLWLHGTTPVILQHHAECGRHDS